MGKQKENESGMMVVEAVLSFTVFIMVVSAIVYLITIFTLHNKVQFAINSAAHEMASYTYLYQASGLRDVDREIASDGEKYVGAIDDAADQIADTLNKIESLKSDAQNVEQLDAAQIRKTLEDLKAAGSSSKESVNKVVGLVSNPNDLMVGVIYMAFNAAEVAVKSLFANAAAAVATKKYLEQGGKDADAYLRGMGVTDGYAGLDFSKSSMFCDVDNKLIDIVVEYDVDLVFVKLLIPNAKLHMIQRVTIPGWLGGDENKSLSQYKGVKKQW